MGRALIGIGFAMIGSLFAPPAFAQTKRPVDKAEKPAPVQKVTFGEGDTVEGGVISPEDFLVHVAKPTRQTTLIRVRADFFPEMRKSAENL